MKVQLVSFSRQFSSISLALLLVTQQTQLGFANSNVGADATAIDPTAITTEAPGWEQTCDKIVYQDPDGRTGTYIAKGLILNLQVGEGSSHPWGPADDQWCENHGQDVSPTLQSDGLEDPKFSKVDKDGATCNVTLSKQDLDRQLTCANMNTNYLRCFFQNSQQLSQCRAAKAANYSRSDLRRIIFLDSVASLTCATAFTACQASSSTGVGAIVGRSIAGGACAAAAATELYQSYEFFVKKRLGGFDFTTLADAAGGAAVATGTTMSFVQLKDIVKEGKSCFPLLVSSLGFAALATSRYSTKKSLDGTVSAASDAIQRLYSQAIPPGGGPGTGGQGISAPAGSTNFGGGGPYGSGGSLNNSGGGGGDDSENAATNICGTINCDGQQGSAAIASEGNILRDSGLDKLVVPELAKLTKGDLKRVVDSGGPAGLIGSGAASAGELGSALAQATRDAQSRASEFASLGGNVPAAMMAGGGGGGGGGGGAKPEGGGLFGGLFGGGGATTQGPSPASVNYGGLAANTDIFHTGTTQNLFQIVSSKIEKVQARVGR